MLHCVGPSVVAAYHGFLAVRITTPLPCIGGAGKPPGPFRSLSFPSCNRSAAGRRTGSPPGGGRTEGGGGELERPTRGAD